MTNWQKLCTQIGSIIRDDIPEKAIHSLFVACLKTIFNWDEGSIKSEVPVPIGRDTKYADIVLYGNDFGIVIEMKRPGIPLGDKEQSQLFSYMRFLGYKYGLLIGNKFQIFYDYKGKLLPIASFAFDANNAGAEEFCEILDKNVCSKEKLFEWVKKTYKAESGGGDNGAGNGCGPKKPEPITIDEIRKKGKLTVADNITFNHIVDILNGLFDCGYRAWMKATWERSHWERLWFPKLALEYYGTKKPLHPIWSNWFEDKNNSVLLEQYRGDNFDNFSYPDPIWHNVKLKRLVFAGYLDKNSKKMVYKFYGVFIFDGVLPNQIIRYKKIGEELIL